MDTASRDLEESRRMVERKAGEIGQTEPVSLTREDLASRKAAVRRLRTLVAVREKLSLKIDYERQRLADREEEKGRYAVGVGRPPGEAGRLAARAAVLLGAALLLVSVLRGWHGWSVFAACVLIAGILGWVPRLGPVGPRGGCRHQARGAGWTALRGRGRAG